MWLIRSKISDVRLISFLCASIRVGQERLSSARAGMENVSYVGGRWQPCRLRIYKVRAFIDSEMMTLGLEMALLTSSMGQWQTLLC